MRTQSSVVVLLTLMACSSSTATLGQLPEPGANQTFHRLGQATVGSSFEIVRQYRTVRNCLIEGDRADCTFVDQNGVEFSVFDDTVYQVAANVNNTSALVTLPLGLRFDDAYDVAVPKLTIGGILWIVGRSRSHDNVVVFSSEEAFPGERDWTFHVEVEFTDGRLTQVKYITQVN